MWNGNHRHKLLPAYYHLAQTATLTYDAARNAISHNPELARRATAEGDLMSPATALVVLPTTQPTGRQWNTPAKHGNIPL